ncbi:DUF1257 domain-containing protein [Streptomyces sp. 8N616]|uniref:DUF1257 domain-containing protein n=1 Tax=Streptomyces sp. 8N616 TaxID=3457414 RepID=UPI003FD10DA7
MSAYITLATPMADQESLVKALADLGFPADRVEVHGSAVPLVGYEGSSRGQRAHVVIRRRHVGQLSNDIGFERTATGFRAHVSDYDQSRYGQQWMRKLRARYQHHDAVKQEILARQIREAAETEARRLAEIEARRREEERQSLVEAQRQAVHDKARNMGYRVQETRQGDTVRLVLVKRVY